ncbi:hypothetical protein CIRMBP1271_02096 [Enterococcus cecorum]|nr:hypothetical protein CIRMBP1267_00052 [Enterococcus cecorum]CAI3386224.1 hypothetical protein CIRMBP1274_01408 [Enterococcus cecorum]CAI3442005.1 hypothetical protein CIRMBP1240_02076 [Enterococcus cecorum]CAI3442719.1 hypothetical protein CIRMBP1265_01998 [Enterococcus cecorum]CAI3449445.1 hypothetical protein CIRMBP1276_02020 [Enterococcus cecorum]
MKTDTYYLLFFTILFTGQYFCLKYEIIENFLWIGLVLYGIYGFLFVDTNNYD